MTTAEREGRRDRGVFLCIAFFNEDTEAEAVSMADYPR